MGSQGARGVKPPGLGHGVQGGVRGFRPQRLEITHFVTISVITSDNEVGEVLFSPLFVCLFVCEQLPDHNFSCEVMKLSGISCYIKIWK